MNLIVVLLLLLAAWLVYSIIQSYNGMQEELKRIRLQCIPKNNSYRPPDDSSSNNLDNPLTNMKNSLLSVLQLTKSYAT